MRAALLYVAATLAIALPAAAQVNPAESDPAVWLKQVYATYIRAQNNQDNLSLAHEASTKLIERRASKSLGALFKREADCVARTHEVCALDWDFVIDGQDYQVTDLNVAAPAVSGDHATVDVTFKNAGVACRNRYSFVRENGQWKVQDVVTKSGKEAPLSVAKLLRDSK